MKKRIQNSVYSVVQKPVSHRGFMDDAGFGVGNIKFFVSLMLIISRYPFLMYLEKRDTLTVNLAIEKLLHGKDVKSLTIDNDISFQKHEALSELLKATVYFCHTFASHEKGTVENRNKAIRRYIKKKSDLSGIDPSVFLMVQEKLRTRFMTCLGFKTPQEAFENEEKKQQKTRLASGVNVMNNVANITVKI